MSHFKTLTLTLILVWTSISNARFHAEISSTTDLKIAVQRVAMKYKADGYSTMDSLKKAAEVVNTDLEPSQRVAVVDEEQCRIAKPHSPAVKIGATILFAGAIACLMFTGAQLPPPASQVGTSVSTSTR